MIDSWTWVDAVHNNLHHKSSTQHKGPFYFEGKYLNIPHIAYIKCYVLNKLDFTKQKQQNQKLKQKEKYKKEPE